MYPPKRSSPFILRGIDSPAKPGAQGAPCRSVSSRNRCLTRRRDSGPNQSGIGRGVSGILTTGMAGVSSGQPRFWSGSRPMEPSGRGMVTDARTRSPARRECTKIIGRVASGNRPRGSPRTGREPPVSRRRFHSKLPVCEEPWLALRDPSEPVVGPARVPA